MDLLIIAIIICLIIVILVPEWPSIVMLTVLLTYFFTTRHVISKNENYHVVNGDNHNNGYHHNNGDNHNNGTGGTHNIKKVRFADKENLTADFDVRTEADIKKLEGSSAEVIKCDLPPDSPSTCNIYGCERCDPIHSSSVKPQYPNRRPFTYSLADETYQNMKIYHEPKDYGQEIFETNDNSADSNIAKYRQAINREKRKMDAAIAKTSDYYKYHFDDEFQQAETREWWGTSEY